MALAQERLAECMVEARWTDSPLTCRGCYELAKTVVRGDHNGSSLKKLLAEEDLVQCTQLCLSPVSRAVSLKRVQHPLPLEGFLLVILLC